MGVGSFLRQCLNCFLPHHPWFYYFITRLFFFFVIISLGDLFSWYINNCALVYPICTYTNEAVSFRLLFEDLAFLTILKRV